MADLTDSVAGPLRRIGSIIMIVMIFSAADRTTTDP